MINLRDEGGIHMLDLKCQYKATKLPWIWRILKPSSWNCVARLYFEKIGGLELLLYSDFAAKTIDFLPPFYKEILLYFKEIVYTEGSGEFIIWNNSNITIKKRTIFNRHWYDNGIIYIHDLMNNDRNIYTYDEFRLKYNINTTKQEFNQIRRSVIRYIEQCISCGQYMECKAENRF